MRSCSTAVIKFHEQCMRTLIFKRGTRISANKPGTRTSPKTKMNGIKEATSVEQLLILGNKKEDIWNKKKITRNETEVFTAVEKQEVNLVKE